MRALVCACGLAAVGVMFPGAVKNAGAACNSALGTSFTLDDVIIGSGMSNVDVTFSSAGTNYV
ncbi:MAG: hypothetical protein WCO77_11665, partial [bacterium]